MLSQKRVVSVWKHYINWQVRYTFRCLLHAPTLRPAVSTAYVRERFHNEGMLVDYKQPLTVKRDPLSAMRAKLILQFYSASLHTHESIRTKILSK